MSTVARTLLTRPDPMATKVLSEAPLLYDEDSYVGVKSRGLRDFETCNRAILSPGEADCQGPTKDPLGSIRFDMVICHDLISRKAESLVTV